MTDTEKEELFEKGKSLYIDYLSALCGDTGNEISAAKAAYKEALNTIISKELGNEFARYEYSSDEVQDLLESLESVFQRQRQIEKKQQTDIKKAQNPEQKQRNKKNGLQNSQRQKGKPKKAQTGGKTKRMPSNKRKKTTEQRDYKKRPTKPQ